MAGERSEEVSEDCEVREKKIMVRVAKRALRTERGLKAGLAAF